MSSPLTIDRVNIRPESSILGVLSHLSYKPWFAVAEFVDNAVQSYLANRAKLQEAKGPNYRLCVQIELDGSRLTVRDNAAGIRQGDYARAFRPAEPPPDASGLSEFGMGMKSAACWLATRWKVRSSALGEPVTRTIELDVADIVRLRVSD